MSFYVRIRRLNGRHDHLALASWLNQSGVMIVDYHSGGWEDQNIHCVYPHLKFEKEEDAAAYVLSHGGIIERIPPVKPE